MDTLVVNALTTPATDFKNVTGFEKVQLNTGVTGAINLAAAGAITDVTYAGTANAADLQGVASGINVNYLASAGGANTIQIANAAINAADVLNVTLGSAAHTAASGGAVNANTVTAATVETINLTSSSKAEMAGLDHQIALNAAGLKTLTIQGNESLVINANAATTALTSVDASKATGLALKGLPDLVHTSHIEPRIVAGRPRWGNQTDSGQNRLSPGEGRAMERARTYQGWADAMASQWGGL